MSTDRIFKTFKVLVPNEITDMVFPAGPSWCSVAEPDPAAVGWAAEGEIPWEMGTDYLVNDRVVYGHRIYLNGTAGVSNSSPPSDPVRWTDQGPTNRWAWADAEASTKTTTTSPLTITIRPGAITHLGFAGMVDVASIRVEMWAKSGGELVHDHTYSTSEISGSSPLWDLYFREPAYSSMRIISGLPTYPACVLRLTLSGYKYHLSVGLIAVGRTEVLGGAEVSATAVYRDYGYSTTNKWGNTVRTPGAKAKDLQCTAVFPVTEANSIDRVLYRLLDSGGIYIPSEQTKFRWLATWGLIKPAQIVAESASHCRASFEVEGLI